jgi:formylglycine-generating enzyme required for sulfatase activity
LSTDTNTLADGFLGQAPIDAYGPQTDTGFFNLLGNGWEWVTDKFTPGPNEVVARPFRGARGTSKDPFKRLALVCCSCLCDASRHRKKRARSSREGLTSTASMGRRTTAFA